MDHLKKNPPKKRLKVLEIGCGWGLLGIYCATTFNARVTGIDADKNVLAFLDVHAEINKVKVEGKKMSFQQLSVEKLKGYDLIVGADVCYWDEMTNILFNLIGRAKKAGVKQIMISDPCRPPFTELVEKCNTKYPESEVEVVEKFLKRPVHASGEILIVS